MTELVQVEVVEHYRDAEGQTRGRWRWHSSGELTPEKASELVKLLKGTHGAARASCSAFEVLAVRSSFALKLIEPPSELALASHEGRQ